MDPESLELKLSLLDEWQSACTHCGICSDSCLTFQETGWEHDSPRGRIRLARDFLNGKVQPHSAALTTFDQCLGCQSCEMSCPIAVPYRQIRQTVQELRVDLRSDSSPSSTHYGKWSALAYRIGSVFWRGYGMWWLAYHHPFLRLSKGRFKKKIEQEGFRKAITLVVSCMQDLFNHDLIEQAVQFINRLGYRVLIDDHQPCCGAILDKCTQAGEEAVGLGKIKQQAIIYQGKRVETFLDWLPKEAYFLGQSCQSFITNQNPERRKVEGDLYAWILNRLVEQKRRLVIDPCTVYYQPYCGQTSKGDNDPILQLLRQIEGLTIRPVPLSKSCCGGFGNEAIDCSERQLWGKSKWHQLPQGSIIVITSPACWKHLINFPEKNSHLVYPIQLLFQARLEFQEYNGTKFNVK